MKQILLVGTAALLLGTGAGLAQSSGGTQVRVQPGHFCAANKCVRFSRDLTEVSIQARRPVSVQDFGLRRNPVISLDAYRKIFRRALVQPGKNERG